MPYRELAEFDLSRAQLRLAQLLLFLERRCVYGGCHLKKRQCDERERVNVIMSVIACLLRKGDSRAFNLHSRAHARMCVEAVHECARVHACACAHVRVCAWVSVDSYVDISYCVLVGLAVCLVSRRFIGTVAVITLALRVLRDSREFWRLNAPLRSRLDVRGQGRAKPNHRCVNLAHTRARL